MIWFVHVASFSGYDLKIEYRRREYNLTNIVTSPMRRPDDVALDYEYVIHMVRISSYTAPTACQKFYFALAARNSSVSN